MKFKAIDIGTEELIFKMASLARLKYIKWISDNRAFRLIGQVLVGPEGARLSGIHCMVGMNACMIDLSRMHSERVMFAEAY